MDQQSILALENNKLLKNSEINMHNIGNSIGHLKHLNVGEVLYREGELAESVYMVLDGEVNLLKKNRDGKFDSVVFSENDFFGAKELFTNIYRCTTTISLVDSYLVEFTKDEINSLIDIDDNIAMNVQQGNKDFKFDFNLIEEYENEYSDDGNNYEQEMIDEFISQNKIDEIINSINEQEQIILENINDFEEKPIINFEYKDSKIIIDNDEKNNYNRIINDNDNIEEKNMSEELNQLKTDYMSSEQFEMIIKALQLVNSNVKRDDVLTNIVDVAINLTNADRGTLYLVDKDSDEIWSKVLIGNEMGEIRLKIGEGVAGWVAENGEILNITDASKDERFDGSFDRATGYSTKNMLVYPIKNKTGETVGVLQLINSLKGGFSKQEEMFLNAISLNVAVALENTSLVEQLISVERKTSIDKMGNFLTYDLKKPILVCKRYAEHLTKKELSFDVKHIVNLLLEQLEQVSNQLASASGFTEGTTLLRRQTLSVNDTLHDYGDNVHNLVKSYHCKVEFELGDDVTINIDKNEFYQAFYNIIKNSCEALPEGGNIWISTQRKDDFIEIYFNDKGSGIESADLRYVFDPLWSKNKKNNSGLGLSISKKIVEDHDGSISINSEKETGTTVIISLPIH